MKSDIQPMPAPRNSSSPERLFIRITDAQGRPRRLETKPGGTSRLLALDEMPGEMKSPPAGNSEQVAATAMRNAIEQAISPTGELHLPPDVQGRLLEILYEHAAPDYAKVKGDDANGNGKAELSDEERRDAVIERLRDKGYDEAALEQVKAAYQWWDVERRKRGNGATFPASAARNGLGGALAGGRAPGSSLRPQQVTDAAGAARFSERYPGAMRIGAEGGGGERRRGLAFDAKAEADFCKRFPQAGRIGTM